MRTHKGKEIDYIEERDGQLFTFELKWNSRKSSEIPKEFAKAYKDFTYTVVNRENLLDQFGE